MNDLPKNKYYEHLKYPFEDKKNICWVITTWEELNLINQQAEGLKVILHNNDMKNHIDPIYTLLDYDELISKKIPTVGMLSNQQEVIRILERLSLESHFYFSIYDAYNKSEVCKERINFVFHDINIILYPSVLIPVYYSCWAFINYIANEVLSSKVEHALDMFAGSGIIGFMLKKRNIVENISFADINFWAKKSIEDTINDYPFLNGKVWCSECFSGIPSTEKYDVIIGNPPHTDKPFETLELFPGCDPEWKIHSLFFEQAGDYLKNQGKIVLIENKYSSVYEKVYLLLGERYKHYEIRKKEYLPNHLCYIIEIIKK